MQLNRVQKILYVHSQNNFDHQIDQLATKNKRLLYIYNENIDVYVVFLNNYRKMCLPNLKTLSDLTNQVYSCMESNKSCLCPKMLFVQDCLLSKNTYCAL